MNKNQENYKMTRRVMINLFRIYNITNVIINKPITKLKFNHKFVLKCIINRR